MPTQVPVEYWRDFQGKVINPDKKERAKGEFDSILENTVTTTQFSLPNVNCQDCFDTMYDKQYGEPCHCYFETMGANYVR